MQRASSCIGELTQLETGTASRASILGVVRSSTGVRRHSQCRRKVCVLILYKRRYMEAIILNAVVSTTELYIFCFRMVPSFLTVYPTLLSAEPLAADHDASAPVALPAQQPAVREPMRQQPGPTEPVQPRP